MSNWKRTTFYEIKVGDTFILPKLSDARIKVFNSDVKFEVGNYKVLRVNKDTIDVIMQNSFLGIDHERKTNYSEYDVEKSLNKLLNTKLEVNKRKIQTIEKFFKVSYVKSIRFPDYDDVKCIQDNKVKGEEVFFTYFDNIYQVYFKEYQDVRKACKSFYLRRDPFIMCRFVLTINKKDIRLKKCKNNVYYVKNNSRKVQTKFDIIKI